MNYIVSAFTDIGIKKNTNQDSLSVKVINTSHGRFVFAILCDGMGGLQKGEVASASVVNAFEKWVTEQLPLMCRNDLKDYIIQSQWEDIVASMNEKIKAYGQRKGMKAGTTAVILLLTADKYFLMNVGDSRIYEISEDIIQLTKDHTFVEREVDLGNMTREQAECDARKNILLQCIGASKEVYPQMHVGRTKKNSVYMLCSDGFRHTISSQEIYDGLNPFVNNNEEEMKKNITKLIEVNKQRLETDNISVVAIRTF